VDTVKLYEIRIGDYLEIVQADARGMRTGKTPEAVMEFAQRKLEYMIRAGEPVNHAEVSRINPVNVSTDEPGMRDLLTFIIKADTVPADVSTLG
jgi:hypothetical protein